MARCLALGVCCEILGKVVPIENINTHGSEIALRLRRFLLKLDNPSALVRIHNAKARRLIPRHLEDADRRLRLVLLVRFKHPRIVHRIDMVT